MLNDVCAKYGVRRQTYRVWRYKTHGINPLLKEEARDSGRRGVARDGIYRTCAANHISSPTYYNWM